MSNAVLPALAGIETCLPKDEAEWLALRARDLTSTEIAALFGVSPYATEFELYHRKKNAEVVTIEAKGRMLWGKRFESTIADGVAEDNGLVIRRMSEYLREPAARIGASFDYSIEDVKADSPKNYYELFQKYGPGLLEIKNVDGLVFRKDWIDDPEMVEAPPHIELQFQHQLAVSRRSWGVIAAMVGGNEPRLILRERDEPIIGTIYQRAEMFWLAVEHGPEPKPDFTRDLATLSKLHGFAEPGKVLHVESDEKIASLAMAYNSASQREAAAKKDKDAAKAELLPLIGDAEKILGDGFTISASLIGPKTIESYERKGYRDFRVSFKKAKEAK